MVKYQREDWDSIERSIPYFSNQHWREVAIDQDKIPLDLDIVKYKELDSRGNLHIITAREDDKLIGYHISLLSTHLHYKSTLHAMVDLYYLLPEYRKSGIGKALFSFVESSLKGIGVKKIYTGTKSHLNFGPLLESLGYRNTELIYTKYIGD